VRLLSVSGKGTDARTENSSAEQDVAARKRANDEWRKTLDGLGGGDAAGSSVGTRGSQR